VTDAHHLGWPCDHNTDAGCHRFDGPRGACPTHATVLTGTAADTACTGNLANFGDLLAHIDGHGWTTAAYYTWLGLLARWGVPAHMDPATVLAETTRHQGGGSTVGRLTDMAVRAAITGDVDTAQAVLGSVTAVDLRTGVGVVGSIAASANYAVHTNAGDETAAVSLGHLFGSQVLTAHGFVAIRPLTDMVLAHMSDDSDAHVAALSSLVEAPTTKPLVAAVDMAGRLMGQLLHEDVTVVSGTGTGRDRFTGLTLDAVVDWRDESLDATTDPGLMPSILAVRVADLYATCDAAEVGARVQAMVRDSGDPLRWCANLLVGAAATLAYMVAADPVPPDGHPG
jgi:hypothetical protein